MSDAKQRLTDAMPFIRIGIEKARIEEPEGEIMLAIISKKKDGTGKVGATFDRAFLDDVAEVLGVKDKPGWMSNE